MYNEIPCPICSKESCVEVDKWNRIYHKDSIMSQIILGSSMKKKTNLFKVFQAFGLKLSQIVKEE